MGGSSSTESNTQGLRAFPIDAYRAEFFEIYCANCEKIFHPPCVPAYVCFSKIYLCMVCQNNIRNKRSNPNFKPISSQHHIKKDFVECHLITNRISKEKEIEIVLQNGIYLIGGILFRCERHESRVIGVCVKHNGVPALRPTDQETEVPFLEADQILEMSQSVCTWCTGHKNCDYMDVLEILGHFQLTQITFPDFEQSFKLVTQALESLNLELVNFHRFKLEIRNRLSKMKNLSPPEKLRNIKQLEVSKMGTEIVIKPKFENNWNDVLNAMAKLKDYSQQKAIPMLERYWMRLAKEVNIEGARVERVDSSVKKDSEQEKNSTDASSDKRELEQLRIRMAEMEELLKKVKIN